MTDTFAPVTLEKDDRRAVAYSQADVVRYEFDGYQRIETSTEDRSPSYRELQEMAKQLEVPAGGSYEELLERVADATAAGDPDPSIDRTGETL